MEKDPFSFFFWPRSQSRLGKQGEGQFGCRLQPSQGDFPSAFFIFCASHFKIPKKEWYLPQSLRQFAVRPFWLLPLYRHWHLPMPWWDWRSHKNRDWHFPFKKVPPGVTKIWCKKGTSKAGALWSCLCNSNPRYCYWGNSFLDFLTHQVGDISFHPLKVQCASSWDSGRRRLIALYRSSVPMCCELPHPEGFEHWFGLYC